ncbi:hypothetical protein B0T14DRAFT_168605 [Immersiella caudata]|uniref:Uncharacterized protein n=1 Tax=Immersiella caudata TaxID=314043 RepID=A0AA39WXJ6_9PEZI|nr:hypothetical protein B0T14DRAFT_168605 [Immersiella caudata]
MARYSEEMIEVPEVVLTHSLSLQKVSLYRRIFGIAIPLLYGEGKRAFVSYHDDISRPGYPGLGHRWFWLRRYWWGRDCKG